MGGVKCHGECKVGWGPKYASVRIGSPGPGLGVTTITVLDVDDCMNIEYTMGHQQARLWSAEVTGHVINPNGQLPGSLRVWESLRQRHQTGIKPPSAAREEKTGPGSFKN